MKILQLNIWGGRLHRQIIRLIEKEQPDILCLQEVVRLPGQEAVFISTLEELQDELQFKYVFFAPLFSFNYMNRTAELGNCIMSKHPIRSEYTEFTNLAYTENLDFTETDDYNVRNFQHAVIEILDNLFHVINHHGHHLREHKNGDESTMRQTTRIAAYIEGLVGPKILCGDFNLKPESTSLEPINSLLINHVKETEVISTRTPLTHKTEACDYIFTSDDIVVKRFEVLDDIASDHKALVIECEL